MFKPEVTTTLHHVFVEAPVLFVSGVQLTDNRLVFGGNFPFVGTNQKESSAVLGSLIN